VRIACHRARATVRPCYSVVVSSIHQMIHLLWRRCVLHKREMSAFFAAAAASNVTLVQCHDYNVDRSFLQFTSTASLGPSTCNAEDISAARLSDMSQRLTLHGVNQKRATSHLNNEHEKIRGITLTNRFRDPDPPGIERRRHVIDELQSRIRSEIMSDLDEEIQRSILAQQELR
jgi:hypothetical protein